MTRLEDFKTTDIELAAAIMTASKAKPLAIIPGLDLVEFVFPDDETTQAVIRKYAAGTLFQEVRRLAAHRKWLYRQIKEVEKKGREVRP
ncbi:hypothetical protein [Geotalea sp. SG265]|uniref:hypothetical protein n=1 Tax=Geotalea sp. SG265 TaxID=2922867 RepID=UPI001FAEF2A4|nr:hypothetical protein [Geotalea sp. SG265]